jgi:hypothetical protein
MPEYAVFLAGLDAFLLDFDDHSVRSPTMESGTLGGACIMNDILEEGVVTRTSRPVLGDKTSDFVVSTARSTYIFVPRSHTGVEWT